MTRVIWIIGVFFILDWGTKRWMDTHLAMYQLTQVIPGWLSLDLIHNTGASFGLLSGDTNLLIRINFSMILVIIYLYNRFRLNSRLAQIGFSLLISGALGNLIDRLYFGYVVDFISFYHFPVIFNIADVEICGGFLLLLSLYLTKRILITKVNPFE
ncbi:signal peptidase II [Scopulibacillus cellulosilyticus]|uniref:Lipoprotein signal peptidase n=1 Tax=Scopulibacillus cellulosilyticus TaxID=2665665 RepID=A0ABW2Q179_9BACL